MNKETKSDTIPYSYAERKAEAEIDRFLYGVSSPAAHTVLDELRNLA